MAKMSKRYIGALDWLLHYEEYFYKDHRNRIMMRPSAPEAAVKSFELYKQANKLRYNHIGYENEYIVDDRPIKTPPDISAMTEEELEAEFQRLFGEYLKEDE